MTPCRGGTSSGAAMRGRGRREGRLDQDGAVYADPKGLQGLGGLERACCSVFQEVSAQIWLWQVPVGRGSGCTVDVKFPMATADSSCETTAVSASAVCCSTLWSFSAIFAIGGFRRSKGLMSAVDSSRNRWNGSPAKTPEMEARIEEPAPKQDRVAIAVGFDIVEITGVTTAALGRDRLVPMIFPWLRSMKVSSALTPQYVSPHGSVQCRRWSSTVPSRVRAS